MFYYFKFLQLNYMHIYVHIFLNDKKAYVDIYCDTLIYKNILENLFHLFNIKLLFFI